jgi:hypothetical protein
MAAPESYVQKLQRAHTTALVTAQLNVARLLRYEPDRSTSVSGLLGPKGYVATRALHDAPPFLSLTDPVARYPDSLVKQRLHQRPRIPSPPLARLPLPRTVPRRSRRGRLEGTQFRSSPYEPSAANAIQHRLHHFSITTRSHRHNTLATIRGNEHIGLRS